MDCTHGVPSMSNCSMSCCQDADRPLLAPVAFLLPAVTTLMGLAGATETIEFARPLEISQVFEPLSPPPRNVSPVL